MSQGTDSPYRIPTESVEAELFLPGVRETVTLFLSKQSNMHPGPETLDEFLNQNRRFFPVRRKSTGEALLIGCGNVLRVDVSSEVPLLARVDDSPISSVDFIRLELEGLPVLEGVIQSSLPREHGRISDFFNTSDLFVPLATGVGVSFVNISRVVRIIL